MKGGIKGPNPKPAQSQGNGPPSDAGEKGNGPPDNPGEKGQGNGPPDNVGEKGPPDHSCEKRNEDAANVFPDCSTPGGLGNDDTCEACCECESDGIKSKCVQMDECDGIVITTGDCAAVCP